MKLSVIRFLAVSFMFILFSLSCKKDNSTPIDCFDYIRPADAYTYPIVPGMPVWATLKPAERLSALQVPANVVTTLSTEALVQSWVDYPLYHEMDASNHIEQFIDFNMQHLNTLVELVKRNDAGAVLLKRYESIQPACITNKSEMEQIKFQYEIRLIEVVLAQYKILSALTATQKKSLAATVLQKYEAKANSQPVYGEMSTLYLGVNLMLASNYVPFVADMQTGTKSASPQYFSAGKPETDLILNHLKNFAK